MSFILSGTLPKGAFYLQMSFDQVCVVVSRHHNGGCKYRALLYIRSDARYTVSVKDHNVSGAIGKVLLKTFGFHNSRVRLTEHFFRVRQDKSTFVVDCLSYKYGVTIEEIRNERKLSKALGRLFIKMSRIGK